MTQLLNSRWMNVFLMMCWVITAIASFAGFSLAPWVVGFMAVTFFLQNLTEWMKKTRKHTHTTPSGEVLTYTGKKADAEDFFRKFSEKI
jgi:hypothetical protein